MSKLSLRNPVIIIFIFLTVWLQLTLWGGKTGIISLNKIKTEIREAAKQGNEIIVQIKKVKQQVSNLNTYPEAIEGIARKNLGLAKPNEKFATFKENVDKKKPD